MTNILSTPTEFYEFDKFSRNRVLTVFQKLKPIGCTYLCYAIEGANKKRYHIYTNTQWQQNYTYGGLINDCPLIHYARYKKPLIMRWNDINASKKSEANVIGIRGEHNLGNGIGMTRWFFDMHEQLSLASELQNIDFPIDAARNIHLIQQYWLEIRDIALSGMVARGWLTSIEADLIKLLGNQR
jgi:hypothetical protein